MFLSFSHVRKQTKYQRRNSLLVDLVFLREDALFSSFPRKLPIFFILLSRTLYLREVCAKFSRSARGQRIVVAKATDSPTLVYLRNDAPLYFSWQPPDLSQSRFLDLSVAFAIALSKLEPGAVNGRTFIKIYQYPPIQQSAHSGSFPRFPEPEQRRLKTR